jgi:hypothetical protein
VHESGSGVAIPHLGGYVALVGDEECACHWRVVAEDPVDLSRGACADSCENVGAV